MRRLAVKLGQLCAVLLVVTFCSFLLMTLLPGDPAQVIMPFADEAKRVELREELGLDEALPVRYAGWLGDFATGDFGSYYNVSSKRPVSTELAQKLPVSLQLMFYAQLLALGLAIPFGVLTAYRAGSRLDRGVSAATSALVSIPSFVLALLLAYYMGVRSGTLPVGGHVPFGEDPAEHFRHMILPAVSLAAGQIAVYVRLLRSDMIATLQEDFVLTAKAKGMRPRRILWGHALRPSSLPLLTIAGMNIGALIGGTVVIEVIFSLPGMGRMLFDAIGARQYVVVQSVVALIAAAYVVVNFVVDLLYSVLDPRIRHARALW